MAFDRYKNWPNDFSVCPQLGKNGSRSAKNTLKENKTEIILDAKKKEVGYSCPAVFCAKRHRYVHLNLGAKSVAFVSWVNPSSDSRLFHRRVGKFSIH